MLFLVGLGLGDERDVTLRGLQVIKASAKVYLEAYTSILLVDKQKLEELYGREIILADREMVEQKVEHILEESLTMDVSFLVVGDPFGATTHSDLFLRAKQMGVKVKVIHNASIMNAIGACGLQLYRFGETISIPYFTNTWKPDSFYDKIQMNRKMGLHTLCLLDIRVKEPSLEAMARGKIVYEAPRYMSVNVAIQQLLLVEEIRKGGAYSAETVCVGVARIGTDSELMISGPMGELEDVDFGPPLHSLVIAGNSHVMEDEMLQLFAVTSLTKKLEKIETEDSEDCENNDNNDNDNF